MSENIKYQEFVIQCWLIINIRPWQQTFPHTMSVPVSLSDLKEILLCGSQTDIIKDTKSLHITVRIHLLPAWRETLTFTMSISLLLLMLLACSCQATHFFGTVMTYYPKKTSTNGSVTVRTSKSAVTFHTNKLSF